jgi:hypothetical protein
MKGYSGRQVPALLVLLLCMFPVLAGAQGADTAGGMEERIETGRFGVEEPEETAAAAEEISHTNRWLYLGIRAGPSMRFYTPEGDTLYTGNDTYSFALDTAVHANVQILPFLSLQGEMVFTWDRASVWAYVFTAGSVSSHNRHTQDYRSFSLAFPFTARFNFYPGKFRVSPFFGLYYLVPLGNMKHTDSRDKTSRSWSFDLSLPLGLLGGISGGVKTGPGILFVDLRYAIDLGRPELPDPALASYRRSIVTLAVGYEFGFFAKKTGKQP